MPTKGRHIVLFFGPIDFSKRSGVGGSFVSSSQRNSGNFFAGDPMGPCALVYRLNVVRPINLYISIGVDTSKTSGRVGGKLPE